MHGTIPHQHSNELSDYDQSKTFAEADGLIDYVKLLFLTDLGECHMETFAQGNNFDFDTEFQLEQSPDLTQFTTDFIVTNHLHNHLIYKLNYTDDVPIIREYFLSNINFRGPPISV